MAVHTLGDSHAHFTFRSIPGVQTHWECSATMKRVGHPEDSLLATLVKPLALAPGDTLIACFGEVDIRCWAHVHASQRRKDPHAFLAEWASRYLDRIAGLDTGGARTFVMSVPPPATFGRATSTALPCQGSDADRALYTRIINSELEKGCARRGIGWLDIHSLYATPDGMLDQSRSDQCVHIADSTAAQTLLEQADILRHGPPPPPKDFFREFADAIRALPPPDPGSGATEWWAGICSDIRRNALAGNREWWEWEGIQKGGIWPGPVGYCAQRLPCLMADPEWTTRWLPALPDGLPSSIALPGCSSAAIGHAARLLRFEQATGSRIAGYDFVFEFGGGYGSLARIAFALGFKGKYLVHDLPELAALQRMCLGERGLSVDHTDNPMPRPPSGARSLAVSMHSADETEWTKTLAFANGLRQYSAMLVTSGCNPHLWVRSAPGKPLMENLPGPPGNYYIISPSK
jgi:hypothetical protein